MNRKRIGKVILVTLLLILLAAAIALAAHFGLRIPCLFHVFTGLNCPGCGNTRAAMSLLRLDFRSMLHYNLLFPLEAAFLVKFYVTTVVHYLRTGVATYKPKYPWIDMVILIVLLLWTVVRNVTPLY